MFVNKERRKVIVSDTKRAKKIVTTANSYD